MNARKTKKKKRSIWKVLLIVLIILIAAGGVAWYGLASSLYGRISYEETGGEESALRQDGVTNILLIGNDSRENGEDGRSDAMILLSISEKNQDGTDDFLPPRYVCGDPGT